MNLKVFLCKKIDYFYKKEIIMTKYQLTSTLQTMPEEFGIDELMERLVILQKIEQGRKDVQEGKIYTTTQAKQKLSKWLR
jgi:hypothetical protein